MDSSNDDNRADINFENILYTVSVPKQKGELINLSNVIERSALCSC